MMQTMPKEVMAAFDAFPPAVRERLVRVREIILEAGRETEGVGVLNETLKWGEPAYLTEETGSGSTIRLGWPKKMPDQAAIYFNCKTTLVPMFRDLFPDAFRYEGNRAILLPLNGALAEDELRLCIGMALTYHRRKR